MYPHIKPTIGRKEAKVAYKYLRSGRYLTESIYTEKLENMLADYLGAKYVSMVPNGTSALYLSLLAAGIGKGDRVAVPDYTMIATPNAVRMVGAEPVLVDIDKSHCMDVERLKNERVDAVVFVEINGRPGKLLEVQRYCKKQGIVLIEDACQSLGSVYRGKKLGTFGRFAAFSLGFHKIITTGQGGFVVTKNIKDYKAVEKLKDFGRLVGGNDVHNSLGFNFKFTDLQAVVGIEQIKTIRKRVKKKKKIYYWFWGKWPNHTPWFLEVMVNNRDKLYNRLMQEGIHTRKLYPPIHTQKIYKRGGFPMSSMVSKLGLWLPSSLDLKKRDIDYIKERVYA